MTTSVIMLPVYCGGLSKPNHALILWLFLKTGKQQRGKTQLRRFLRCFFSLDRIVTLHFHYSLSKACSLQSSLLLQLHELNHLWRHHYEKQSHYFTEFPKSDKKFKWSKVRIWTCQSSNTPSNSTRCSWRSFAARGVHTDVLSNVCRQKGTPVRPNHLLNHSTDASLLPAPPLCKRHY